MAYHLEYSKRAIKDLKKLDPATRKLIYGWLDKNLHNCENPRLQGKALRGNLQGLWRYKIGDYRVITKINDDCLIIIALNIGHRRDIYKITL